VVANPWAQAVVNPWVQVVVNPWVQVVVNPWVQAVVNPWVQAVADRWTTREASIQTLCFLTLTANRRIQYSRAATDLTSKEVFLCSKRTSQTMVSASYDKDGKFIRAYPTPGAVEDIVPGSVYAAILKLVCAPDFPKQKSGEFYFPATNNDVFKHTADIFEIERAKNTDPAPN
jgi:hypothetical protein